MKNFIKFLGTVSMLLLFVLSLSAQKKALLTVLNFDSQGIDYSPEQLGNLARMEVEKLDKYEVMDRYDVKYMIEKHDLGIENCYGKICLTEVGEIIDSDKMLSGTVETFGDIMIVSIRLIDVKSKSIEKAYVREYINQPKQIRMIFEISIREMFGLENDPGVVKQLTKKDRYESSISNPDTERLNLSGPRFGGTYFTGDIADVLTAEKNKGGYDVSPYMYMLGYQFEVQYLNSGKLQALFEFIPSITGAEQGVFLPNLNILHGLRHNIQGWEFAMGLTVGVNKRAVGYYDADNEWHLLSEWDYSEPFPYEEEKRIDSRGSLTLNTGFLIAAGKSFKSGRMNIPVNAFIIPSKDGIRAGITLGFNARKKK